jgi:acetyl esterase
MPAIADPELEAIRHILPTPDLTDLPAAREQSRRFVAQPYEPSRKLTISDLVVAGAYGSPEVPVRIFAPTDRTGPLPGLLYLRGSGFVLGTIDIADAPACRIADEVDVAVIAIDCRMAPEHPYPAALDDSFAALLWATSWKAIDYGIDPGRVAVLGDGAGGGLAVALSMLTRDRNGPAVVAQFLEAPMVDDSCSTPSMAEFTDTPMWRSPDLSISWEHYLAEIPRGGGGDVPLYAAPARAGVEDLVGLPPTWIAAYQLDPTRDEALAFAGRLIQAGVSTELHHYAGAFHAAHAIPGTAIGERIFSDKLCAIRRMLAPTS